MDSVTTHIETEKQQTSLGQSRKVPELRFKEFDGDIEETLFGNHYSFHTTNSLSRDKLNYDKGEVRNIHYGDIHTKFQTHFHLTNEYVPFINEDVDLAKIKEDSYCKVGDLVIADASEDYADIGKSIELIDINNEKLLAGLHTFLARPSSNGTALGYISCVLKSWKLRKQVMIIAQGTKVLSLSTGRVSKLKLNIPSLPEQQKIASFLSAVDEKIQQLTKKKELLEQYKKGVMQQLFSGQLRFKDKNGNPYPDWELTKLKGLCEPITKGTTPKKFVDNGVTFIKIEGIKGINFNKEKCLFIDEETHLKELKRSILKVNDILFAIAGSVGKLGIVTEDLLPANTNQAFAIIRLKNLKSLKFILQVLNSRTMKKYIYQSMSVGAQPNLNLEQMGDFKFLLPSLEEQEKIATYLSSIDTKIGSVNNQITQTQTFKKGLLQQMFV